LFWLGFDLYQYYERIFTRLARIHVVEFHQYEQVIKHKAGQTKTTCIMLETNIGRFRLSNQLAQQMRIGGCYEVLGV
jgi:hypothetical protein